MPDRDDLAPLPPVGQSNAEAPPKKVRELLQPDKRPHEPKIPSNN